MEHTVPSENFQRQNGTTFSEVPLFPEIFQWNEPKNHIPFATQPEFSEYLGKWKTPHLSRFDIGNENANCPSSDSDKTFQLRLYTRSASTAVIELGRLQ